MLLKVYGVEAQNPQFSRFEFVIIAPWILLFQDLLSHDANKSFGAKAQLQTLQSISPQNNK